MERGLIPSTNTTADLDEIAEFKKNTKELLEIELGLVKVLAGRIDEQMVQYMEEHNLPVSNYKSLNQVIEKNEKNWHRSRTLYYLGNEETKKDIFNPHRDVNLFTVFSRDTYVLNHQRYELEGDPEAGYYIEVESQGGLIKILIEEGDLGFQLGIVAQILTAKQYHGIIHRCFTTQDRTLDRIQHVQSFDVQANEVI